MKKLEEKRQFLIGVFLLVVMVLFYFKVLFFPLVGKLKQLGETADQYRRDLAVTEAGLARMVQIKQEIDRLEGLVGKAQRHFPSERNRQLLLEELSEIAANAGVKILEVAPGIGNSATASKGPAIKGLQELPVTITALSGYHEFATFVNALENSERVYLIQNLSIRSREESDRLHSLRLVLSVFLQEEGPAR